MLIDHTWYALEERSLHIDADGERWTLLTLGKGSYIVNASYENPSARAHVLIGNYCSIAHNIRFIVAMNHDYRQVTTYPFNADEVCDFWKTFHPQLNYSIPEFTYPRNNKTKNPHQVVIGNDVWIGAATTIMSGTHIGNGAVIGSGAVVAKDIPPYAIAVGNPAKVIKYRFDEETRKKFMAVKWWSWNIDKVLANVPLMNNPEKFFEKHYSPELENIPQDNLGGGVDIKNLRVTGRKIYSFVGDFSAPQPLWKRVLDGFFKSTSAGDILVFWVDEGSVDEKIDELNNFLNGRELTDGKIIFGFTPKDGKIFSPYILRNSTHFITTREMISLECMDWLWDTDVKIVSALDEGIFDGEPEVNWGEIIGK